MKPHFRGEQKQKMISSLLWKEALLLSRRHAALPTNRHLGRGLCTGSGAPRWIPPTEDLSKTEVVDQHAQEKEGPVRVEEVVALLKDLKGKDVAALDVQGKSPLPIDHMVLATSVSSAHSRRVAGHVKDFFERRLEGRPEAQREALFPTSKPNQEWTLVAADGILVNLLSGEARAKYDLDGLYGREVPPPLFEEEQRRR